MLNIDDQAQYTFCERVPVSLWNMRTLLQSLNVRLECEIMIDAQIENIVRKADVLPTLVAISIQRR